MSILAATNILVFLISNLTKLQNSTSRSLLWTYKNDCWKCDGFSLWFDEIILTCKSRKKIIIKFDNNICMNENILLESFEGEFFSEEIFWCITKDYSTKCALYFVQIKHNILLTFYFTLCFHWQIQCLFITWILCQLRTRNIYITILPL